MVHSSASFLGLPVELRFPIYKLLFNRYDGIYKPNILLVCRQIRTEAIPLYLECTRYFSTLEKLIRWTSTGNPDLLCHVKDISIQLLNNNPVDWDSLLSAAHEAAKEEAMQDTEPYSDAWWAAQFAMDAHTLPDIASPVSEQSQSSFRTRLIPQRFKTVFRSKQLDPSTQDQGKSLIHQLWSALKAIDNVQSCWIKLSHEDPKIQPIIQLLLRMVPAAFPAIRNFSCFSPLVSMDFLRHFRDLRMLRFTGYSKSTPEELLQILRSLKSLDAISIYRYPEFDDREKGIVTADLPKHLSLTAEVIASMKPLRSLQIWHMASGVASEHLTVPMIQAWENHRFSLRTLNVDANQRLDKTVVLKLIDFVATSSLRNIHLRSQGDLKPLDISEYIPSTAQHCDARLKCDGFGIKVAPSSTQFHNHTFSEVDIRDPLYASILDDSFANQVLR
ncbi:uncharacterized protein K441DRAFT_697583 [Cenococcum geophilum 1.58]|uniref:uncharacterized protein n=1 Tax=Cenococcum geophilum 1.58 TaxID=794803 RepID=UPI00358DDF29|nr:hypothetical protein K441DRAFT_697583 [Cenococcum geophilum 1.58]